MLNHGIVGGFTFAFGFHHSQREGAFQLSHRAHDGSRHVLFSGISMSLLNIFFPSNVKQQCQRTSCGMDCLSCQILAVEVKEKCLKICSLGHFMLDVFQKATKHIELRSYLSDTVSFFCGDSHLSFKGLMY